MSVVAVGPVTDQAVSAECGTCELPFLGSTPDRAEVEHLVGVHNDLHHAGRDEAYLVIPESGIEDVAQDEHEDVDQDEDVDEL